MSSLTIEKYHKEVQDIIDYGGTKKETAIRFAFHKLLDDYASQKGLKLVAEVSIKTPSGHTVTPDGTLKDSLRFDWGYWESKDEADDIDLEIQKKFAKGYPKENILFEDSQTAVLIQNGNEVLRVNMKDGGLLDKIIKAFINYERPEVQNFRKAIELFKSDIPNVVSALRNLISEQFESRDEGRETRGEDRGIREIGVNEEILSINNKEDFDGKRNNQNLSGPKNVAGSDESCNNDLPDNEEFSEGRNLRTDLTVEASSSINTIEHSRRASEEQHEGIYPISVNSEGFVSRSGNSNDNSGEVELSDNGNSKSEIRTNEENWKYAGSIDEIFRKKESINASHPTSLATRPKKSLFQQKCSEFLETCKQSINPDISIDDINEMMIQHILTADIFNTIFDEPYFHRENNIAQQLESVINTFFTRNIRENLMTQINQYYQAINATAAGIIDHHEKQKFLKIVYETFYKAYNPKSADRLGVVYTPDEIVKFQIESIDYLLQKHFGVLLSDKNVEILDPATGTGTYVCALIDYLPKEKLEYKYKNEIHANEVAILPYYIANLNIEFTYKQRMGRYEEFQNLCFVDTLDNMGFDYKNKQEDMFGFSAENTERIQRQNERKISVIVGNPPYNANQMNENDNNKNREYPIIDQRIKDTYIKHSTAQKTKLYDMYSRFYRWAMDRLGDEGVIAFITNRYFIESRTFDGFRKIAASEFDHIYIVDLGGDVRSNPKLSGTKHNVFAIQTGVAMLFLVKNQENKIVVTDEEEFQYLKKTLKLKKGVSEPEVFYGEEKYISPKGCRIFYMRRPEMETAKEKLEFLSSNKLSDLIRNGSYDNIRPDKNNNWINLTDNDWDNMIPIFKKSSKSLTNTCFLGVSTNRDEWVYDYSRNHLTDRIIYFSNVFNSLELKNNYSSIDSIKWSRDLKNKKMTSKLILYNENNLKPIYYRPFIKKFFYCDKVLIDRFTQNHIDTIGKNFDLFNITIVINYNSSKDFNVLVISGLCDLHFNGDSNCLPLFLYDNDNNKIDNITDWGLQQFHLNYNDTYISKEDIFHYVYGVLHNPEYRMKYELNLKREFPRIPFYDDFWKWAKWGEKLMDLHINFEIVEPYPLTINTIELDREVYKPKLKAIKDEGKIELDNQTTISGIPKEAWNYKLGNRSGLEWILDQYKEKKPKDPTIAKMFNTYKFIDYKDKVIDLIMRVTTVSVETMKIIKEMEGN